MWRLRQAAALVKRASHSRGILLRSSAGGKKWDLASATHTQRLWGLRSGTIAPASREVLPRRCMSTGARRISPIDDGELSEGDELESESQDVKELEVPEEVRGDADEHEPISGNVEPGREIGDEQQHRAAAGSFGKMKPPSENARSFGKANLPLDEKGQQIWMQVDGVQRGEKVVPVLENWLDQGNELTLETLSALVGRLRRATRFGFALEIVEWMLQKDEYKEFASLRSAVIECMARFKGINAVEKYFGELSAEQKSKPVYEAFLMPLVNRGHVKKSEALFEEMEKAGFVAGSPHSINLMLRLYKQARNESKFQKMLEKAKDGNVEKNVQTYNLIMEMKSRSGDVEGMEKTFEDMKTAGLQPDAMSYITLARGYLNKGMKEKAELYLLRLENGTFKKSKRVYEILMDFYADLGSKDEVNRMWSRCKLMLGDGANSYLQYMNALAKLGETERVETMFERAEKWRSSKNVHERRYNNLLTAYVVAGNTEKVKELEEKMKEAGVTKTAMKKLVKKVAASPEQNAKNEASKAQKTKVFTERLDEAEAEGDVNKAEVVFEECRKSKCSDVEMWNMLLRVYKKAEMPAYGFEQRMAADKVAPSEETMKLLEEIDAVI